MATSSSLAKILNKVCKWRTIFAGWQLGTRSTEDPECQAVRDHRELSILLRIEVNAQTQLLIKKKFFSEQEWTDQLELEAKLFDEGMEQRFPGAHTTDDGVVLDPKAMPWMSKWRK